MDLVEMLNEATLGHWKIGKRRFCQIKIDFMIVWPSKSSRYKLVLCKFHRKSDDNPIDLGVLHLLGQAQLGGCGWWWIKLGCGTTWGNIHKVMITQYIFWIWLWIKYILWILIIIQVQKMYFSGILHVFDSRKLYDSFNLLGFLGELAPDKVA